MSNLELNLLTLNQKLDNLFTILDDAHSLDIYRNLINEETKQLTIDNHQLIMAHIVEHILRLLVVIAANATPYQIYAVIDIAEFVNNCIMTYANNNYVG